MNNIHIPISPGELLDKLTILQIKSENITDASKLANVNIERTALQSVADKHIPNTPALQNMTAALLAVNKLLWTIEDDIRSCESQNEFGDKFISLARAVYTNNDKRAEIKKQINQTMGSTLTEEKSYMGFNKV